MLVVRESKNGTAPAGTSPRAVAGRGADRMLAFIIVGPSHLLRFFSGLDVILVPYMLASSGRARCFNARAGQRPDPCPQDGGKMRQPV